ncbi:lamin tail domain-containing protein [Rhodothermus bifroesti]|uniref:LTD domain-containing protein n=1 Tax=Rhodothermus marinus TaxID=29549 RepID=A0A7V2B0Q4_RHOMR|nr:lamin tail domain-containing protein [Rhodothermus bifroesti]GBD00551.1 hypothetical protein HRbin18_00261 [bacterium HR18]
MLRALCVLLGLYPLSLHAQLIESFDDGDFLNHPSWQGTTAYWTIDFQNNNPFLRTQGPSAADTLFLSTPSQVCWGVWQLTFYYENVNFSNFNGFRIYLMSDTADLLAPLRGYFVQLGTNNSDEIRLYRQDGDPATRRILLGRSNPLLTETQGKHTLRILRSETGHWTVSLDGQVLFEAQDATYWHSRFFGLWVKHTATTAQNYGFDDLLVAGERERPDRTPPRILSALYRQQLRAFVLHFSEAMDTTRLADDAFFVERLGFPESQRWSGDPLGQVVQLIFTDIPPSGIYTLYARSLYDLAGNPLGDTSLTVVARTDTQPPRLREAYPVNSQQLNVHFDEPVYGCDPAHYQIAPPQTIATILDCPSSPRPDYTLQLAFPLTAGETYRLQLTHIADTVGNLLTGVTYAFTFPGDAQPIAPGDVVLNEVLYAPTEDATEFFELYNRSPHAIDLQQLQWYDTRRQPIPLSQRPFLVGPEAYVVIAQDTALLERAFGPIAYRVQPPSWSALNNDGDAVVLVRADKVVIDSMAYTAVMGKPGYSLERRDPGLPATIPENWAPSDAPERATPGRVNSRYEPDLRAPLLLFAAVRDSTTVVLTVDEPLHPSAVHPDAFELDDGTRPVDAIWQAEQQQIVLRFAAQLRQRHLTARQLCDLKNQCRATATRPLAYPPAPGSLIINEILYAPRANPYDGYPDQPEYLELLNRAAYYLDLEGLYWTNRPNELGRADTFYLPARFQALAPDSLALVFSVPTSSDPLVFLDEAFPGTTQQPGTVWLPMRRSSLSLRNEGDVVHLRYRAHTLDAVAYAPSWHQKGIRDATGLALERLLPDGPSNDPTNWTTSPDPSGGTPGRPNAAQVQRTQWPTQTPELWITPSPFSPDGDGTDDVTILHFRLPATGTVAQAQIFDSYGRRVRTLGPIVAGAEGMLLWDGRDQEGRELPIGLYVVLFEALDARGGRLLTRKAPVVLARPLH